MTRLSIRFEKMIAHAVDTLPELSPEAHAYIAHVRDHARLSAASYTSDAAFDAWRASVEDDSAWKALTDDERAAFNASIKLAS